MAFHFDTPLYSFTPSRHVQSPVEDDVWSAPLVPGLFDLDPSAPSPVKMTFDFEPLHYECKKLGQKSVHSSAPPAPRLISSEWGTPKGDDMGMETFEAETTHIENAFEQPPLLLAPTPTRYNLAPKSASSPLPLASSPSLLRAPRLPTRPLLSSPGSPLMAGPEALSSIVPPVEGTRPAAPPRFSALGLDLTAAARPEVSYLPSPPASPTAGRGRRRARASTIEASHEEERGRTRERCRRTDADEDLPGLAYSNEEPNLHARVANWSNEVAAATNSGPSTPPEAAPLTLPVYNEVELATALGRLNADAVGSVNIPASTSLPETRPRVVRSSSLQPERRLDRDMQQSTAWALRVGQSRGRVINMPRLQRAATSFTVGQPPRHI